MEDHGPNQGGRPTEQPVRSRWTPKPEQILILESIFNSGMVNPTKQDTVRIRKLLEKFGTVGDANVFYWFQNRRSRSRRRQRMLMTQAANNNNNNNNGATMNLSHQSQLLIPSSHEGINCYGLLSSSNNYPNYYNIGSCSSSPSSSNNLFSASLGQEFGGVAHENLLSVILGGHVGFDGSDHHNSSGTLSMFCPSVMCSDSISACPSGNYM